MRRTDQAARFERGELAESALRLCGNEVLRLFPPTPFFIRRATRDTTLPSGLDVPTGDYIVLNAIAVSYSTTAFGDNAHEFKTLPGEKQGRGVDRHFVRWRRAALYREGLPPAISQVPGEDPSEPAEFMVACLHETAPAGKTVLGPALGGTRFYPFPDEAAALADVLSLSRAMAYKAACAGLNLGGGKAVIIGNPQRDKTETLLRAYGRFVQSLGGRYYTACDVGTDVRDMDVIARECRFVTGRTAAFGGAGDSAVLTAFGVMQGMRAAAERMWGAAHLHDRG